VEAVVYWKCWMELTRSFTPDPGRLDSALFSLLYKTSLSSLSSMRCWYSAWPYQRGLCRCKYWN
jgi:hypothetical protein